jgi:Flp pilus assembly protein TadG
MPLSYEFKRYLSYFVSRRNRERGERGAALVEYGFGVIIFLSLAFGASGFGHALFVYHHVNNAAKEAARYAAVRGATCSLDSSCVASNSATNNAGPTTQDDMQHFVQNMTPTGINSSIITATATWPGPASPLICKQSITVTVGKTTEVIPQWPVNNPGCTVQVNVTYSYNFVFPLIHLAPVNMSSTAEMVIVH